MSNDKPNDKTAAPAAAPQKQITIGASELQSLVKSIAEEMLGVSVAAATAMRPQAAPTGHQARNFGPRCGTCGQYESACKGEHVDLCVYPVNYPEFGDFFQGVILNGVKYLSNGPGHVLKVPKCSESEIRCIIKGYEQNERECRVGRSKQHNSGSIHNPIPANAAWR